MLILKLTIHVLLTYWITGVLKEKYKFKPSSISEEDQQKILMSLDKEDLAKLVTSMKQSSGKEKDDNSIADSWNNVGAERPIGNSDEKKDEEGGKKDEDFGNDLDQSNNVGW